MTDDVEGRLDEDEDKDNHQQAVEACQHALDALHGGDLARAQSLLDEAQTAVEHAQHDRPAQASRETVYDCYE